MTSVSLDAAPPRPRAASLSCPSCGAGIALHAQGWAVSVVCESCGSVLDATDSMLRILQRHEEAVSVRPRLPLGTRGTWKGISWELIGFQVVTITVDGTDYSWSEYVAFNPYHGFWYLSEYQGHWTVIEKLRRRPREEFGGNRPTATLDGREYKHFQTSLARTTAALGEFPWQLQVGDTVAARDYVAPPFILSAESTDGETTWSLGTYTPPEVIAKAFGGTTPMITPIGVFANQPNPHVHTAGRVLRTLGLLLALMVAMLVGNVMMSRGETVFTNRYAFAHGTEDSAAFVTPVFALTGRPTSVVVEIDSDADNDWVYFDFTLINETTGIATEFSKQIEYYYGRDSDGSWTEGSRTGRVRVSSIPAGRYFLRVAPVGGETSRGGVNYSLRVRRDVPSYLFYGLALVVLLLPALLALLPKAAFEQRRWAESDYGSETGTVSSGDEGDDE